MHTEVARWEWRADTLTDPRNSMENFLRIHQLPVYAHEFGKKHSAYRGQLFVSAMGAAVLGGGARGAATPVPEIPDIVIAIVRDETQAHTYGGLHDASTTFSVGEWEKTWTDEQHMDAIRQVHQAIASGDVYQVNMVSHRRAPYAGDPLDALRAVASLPGARYGGILKGPDWMIASGTPELLCSVHEGVISTRPIKGTAPHTASGREMLLSSPKERAEHVMIVDLMRNDLAKIAATGTVSVPELFTLQQWCHLWQAESTIKASVRPDISIVDILAAVCPGGSVTGAPKLAALEQIAHLEPVGRGPSMGALGSVTHQGLDLGLTIRTVAAASSYLHLWVGGGITIDSDPHSEVAEANAKAMPIVAAIGQQYSHQRSARVAPSIPG